MPHSTPTSPITLSTTEPTNPHSLTSRSTPQPPTSVTPQNPPYSSPRTPHHSAHHPYHSPPQPLSRHRFCARCRGDRYENWPREALPLWDQLRLRSPEGCSGRVCARSVGALSPRTPIVNTGPPPACRTRMRRGCGAGAEGRWPLR